MSRTTLGFLDNQLIIYNVNIPGIHVTHPHAKKCLIWLPYNALNDLFSHPILYPNKISCERIQAENDRKNALRVPILVYKIANDRLNFLSGCRDEPTIDISENSVFSTSF